MGYETDIACLEQQAVFDIRTVTPTIDDCLHGLDIRGSIEKDRIIVTHEMELLKLGPRRALITSTLSNEFQIEEKLKNRLGNAGAASVVNVSDMYLGIQVSGRDAAQVLAHATPINLHDFPPGSGTATAVFSLSGIVLHVSESTYSVYVDRSFFDYVWQQIKVCGLKSVPTEIRNTRK